MTKCRVTITDSEFELVKAQRDEAQGRADVAERELRQANLTITTALANLEAADHCCCPCGAPGCGDSICNICRARLELGGSL